VVTIVALAVVAYAAPSTVSADPVDATATVSKVVDGDTIDIRDDNRGRLRVRLLGIDAPETKKPGYTIGLMASPLENPERRLTAGRSSRQEVIVPYSRGVGGA
jgi:endonuclease YncB( thermonuclease family)